MAQLFGAGSRRRRLSAELKLTTVLVGISAVAAATVPASGASDINTGSTYLASNVGSSVNAVFNGGTLQLDSSTTISHNFTVQNVSTNTIDTDGNTATLSGNFTGSGPLTFINSKTGGNVTLSGSGNTYSGATTINSGASVLLTGTGTISSSASLTDNGNFDISGTTSGATIISLSGSGTVNVGSQFLTISNGAGTFSGVISGSGGVALTAGSETLTGVNTYTGATTVSTGTLALSGSGSIASSSSVYTSGVFDISATSGTSIQSLSGTGRVELGAQTLTITNASGVFSGVIDGSGGLTMAGGTELLYGTNTFTGPVTITGGTLEIGSPTITYNIANNAAFAFDSAATISMTGVISGSGSVTQTGGGITTVTAAQTYTGATNITSGTLKLSGTGSIASSSGVNLSGAFDISGVTAASGASITTLSGTGSVNLGSQTLTLTNASGSYSGTISGTGNLVLASGSETMLGANTYTGKTTIASGTLYLPPGSSLKSAVVNNATLDVSAGSSTVGTGSSSIGSLSGNGVVNVGGDTLIITNASDTFSGTISGTGGLMINGGTETLSGINTYTGATTVAGGTLALTSSGSLSSSSAVTVNGTFDVSQASGSTITFASLSGSGTMKLGALTLNLAGGTGTFTGTIQGTGGLIVNGGTEVLAGANTYTGATVINSGTLQIGNGFFDGSIVGNVTDNGTLAFGGADTSVFAGTISGNGDVSQTGRGTTILAADNTYSGGTTISHGTLQIGNGGTSGAILGNVVDNGVLAFARSDGVTFGGLISGTGGVAALNGNTTLTAAETYTGATTVASGATLTLGAGGSIATSNDITDNGTFDVSAASAPQISSLDGSGSVTLGSQTLTLTAASGTFSGAIAGTGGLTLATGNETLSGTNSYTGATVLNGGTLTVNGSIAASQGVTVNSGATLAGTGHVGAVTVASGGTLAPGSAGSGTLTAGGPVTFASGSNYVVNVSSTSVSGLTTTSTASLAGTLTVKSADGTYLLGQKQAVLTADGGVTGQFTLAPLTSTGADLTSVLSYDANNVYLEVDLAKLSPLLPTGATTNQKNVVGGIDAAIVAAGSSPLPQSFEDLGNLSSASLGTDSTQLAGEIGADVPLAGSALFSPFIQAIFDHISTGRTDTASPPLRASTGAWLTALSGSGIVAGDPTGTGSHKFKSSATGLIAGANWMLTRNILVGAAVSGGYSGFHLGGDIGTGKVHAIQAAVYGFAQYSPHFYGSFAAALAVDDIKTTRTLTVSGTDTLTGSLTAMTYGGRYETGIQLPWLTPYAAFQDVLMSLPAYSEKAASGADTFALHYGSRTINTGTAELGLRHSIDIRFRPEWVLTPNFTLHLSDRLAWTHEFSGGSSSAASFVNLPDSGFTVYRAKADKDAALVSLGTEAKFDGGLSLQTRLQVTLSPNSQNYMSYAGLGYRW